MVINVNDRTLSFSRVDISIGVRRKIATVVLIDEESGYDDTHHRDFGANLEHRKMGVLKINDKSASISLTGLYIHLSYDLHTN